MGLLPNNCEKCWDDPCICNSLPPSEKEKEFVMTLKIYPANGIEDKQHLEKLGIIVGKYKYEGECFTNCKVNNEAFKKLEPYWLIRYIWGPQL